MAIVERDASRVMKRKVTPDADEEPEKLDPVAAMDLQSSPSAKRQRPSFASPTRATMERYNPEILRSRQPSPKRQRASTTATSPTRISNGAVSSGAPTARTLFQASATQSKQDRGVSRDLNPRAGSSGRFDAAAASEPQSTATVASPTRLGESTSPAEDSNTANVTPSKKMAYEPAPKPSPRPLPPPAPEEDILETSLRHKQHRYPNGLVPDVVITEPELPPTPQHPDPVVSTPPSGIHNTPSKRPKRSRTVPDRSSPLKGHSRSSGFGFDIAVPIVVPRTTSELRGIKSEKPKSSQEKRIAELESRNRELRSRSATLASYNEQVQAAEPDTLDASDMLSFLTDVISGDSGKESRPTSVWDAGLDISRFLPFGGTGSSLPALFPQVTDEPDEEIATHRPLPVTNKNKHFISSFSHLKLSTRTEVESGETGGWNDENTLRQKHYITAESIHPPGIRLFSTIVTANTENLKVHDIQIPHIHPAAAAETRDFLAGITKPGEHSARTTNNNVTVMGVAMSEWLRVAVARANTWRVLQTELGTKQGLENLAQTLYDHEAALEASDADDEDEDIEDSWPGSHDRANRSPDDEAHNVNGAAKKTGRRERARPIAPARPAQRASGEENPATSESYAESLESLSETSHAYWISRERPGSASHLLPYLGRTSMHFQIPRLDTADGADAEEITLRVQWRIKFKPTGYAASDISVLVGTPNKCELLFSLSCQ